MNKIKMNIWGRDFDLPVMIKQFKGKEITDIQKDAVEKFTSCEKVVNEAKNDVEKYVIKNGLKDMGMDSVDNIFKYVIPKTISVPKAKKRVVAIVLLLFIPNYIHIIYPYIQSWIANFKLCTLVLEYK